MGIPAAGTTMVDALRDEDLFSTCSFQVGLLEFPNSKFILDRLRERLNKHLIFPRDLHVLQCDGNDFATC